jgi:RNA binding exosome subunit
MKALHNVTITVFVKNDENREEIKDCLLKLVSFDIAKEKIKLEEDTALGLNEDAISIYKIFLEKERHVKKFIDDLLSKLTDDQKEMLLQQAESRVDDECNFFLRLHKDRLIKGEYIITDSGNCFHIKMAVAAYPAIKDKALQVVKELLQS